MKIVTKKQGDGLELAQEFSCTTVTVSKALNYKTNSALARKIRAAAMARGGIEYDLIERRRNTL